MRTDEGINKSGNHTATIDKRRWRQTLFCAAKNDEQKGGQGHFRREQRDE